MSGKDPFSRSEGDFEYALRVLRLYAPGSPKEKTKVVENPPEVLRRGFELADREYDRLLSSIDPKYYHEFAVPAHLDVDKETAQLLLASLGMRQAFPGVLGPEGVHHEGKLYKVWIQVFPCG